MSKDFKTAFLQGGKLERDIYMVPPLGYCSPGKIWKLKRPAYGICSAPKAWYDKLVEVMTESGLTGLTADEGVFVILDEDGVSQGILALHVDDATGGGDELFTNVLQKVSSVLEVGSHMKWKILSMRG